MSVYGYLKIAHLLAAWTLSDEPAYMLSHLLPLASFPYQFVHCPFHSMMAQYPIMYTKDLIVNCFSQGELLIEVMELFFLQWQ